MIKFKRVRIFSWFFPSANLLTVISVSRIAGEYFPMATTAAKSQETYLYAAMSLFNTPKILFWVSFIIISSFLAFLCGRFIDKHYWPVYHYRNNAN